ncbi:redoxin family protein [Catellatospora sp. NPDC049609]|uniref:TlpA family protein disulfide reductase n=1 Tax=Catellatospora sp. NPDC049609 TaxID=3155505 RepID=UPI0034244197
MSTGLLVAVVVLAAVCVLNLALVLRLSTLVRRQGAARAAADTPATLPAPGAALPAFAGVGATGVPVSSADLATGTVLVAFLSATCAPCRESLPDLAATATGLRETVPVVAVVSAPSHVDPADMIAALAGSCAVIVADGYHDPRFAGFGVGNYPTFLRYDDGVLGAAAHLLPELALPVPA